MLKLSSPDKYAKAISLSVLGEHDLAIALVLSLNRKEESRDLILARLYSNKGDIGQAVYYAKKMVNKNKEDGGYYNFVGILYNDRGELNTAERWFKLSIKVDKEGKLLVPR